MVFQITQTKDSKIDQFYEKAMQELDEFFELNWKRNIPNIILVDDRKTINLLYGKTTEDWLVAWVPFGKDIYLLNPNNYEKESSHKYSDETFFARIKHELVHCYVNVITNALHKKPIWLLEGITVYLSGQNKFKTKPKKLKEFLKFYNKCGSDVYYESGFAVEFLVEKYGKTKILQLIKEMKNAKSEKEFKKLFKKIYGFELKYENFEVVNP